MAPRGKPQSFAKMGRPRSCPGSSILDCVKANGFGLKLRAAAVGVTRKICIDKKRGMGHASDQVGECTFLCKDDGSHLWGDGTPRDSYCPGGWVRQLGLRTAHGGHGWSCTCRVWGFRALLLWWLRIRFWYPWGVGVQ